MWCQTCESDVATEVAADGQSLLCVSCRSKVQRLTAPSLHPDIRRAREILDRLSAAAAPTAATDGALNSTGEPASASEQTTEDEPVELDDVLAAVTSDLETDDEPAAESTTPTPKQFRIDGSHPTADVARSHVGHDLDQPANSSPARARRNDDPHASLPAPHFDVQPARPRPAAGRGETAWGQLLAYAGVAVLTIGTALVVWGYLGGPETYAPTGWLVATIGQMLLLLGVVTLVAGGMQQTTHEVSSRVAHLNGRVIRVEQTANEILRGPHFGETADRAGSTAERTRDADAEKL